MMNILKLAGISAVLAAVFVIAIEASKAESLGSVRLVGESAVQNAVQNASLPAVHDDPGAAAARPPAVETSGRCRAQAWPYVDRGCIASETPVRKPVRTIAIEQRRDGAGAPDPVPVPFHAGR